MKYVGIHSTAVMKIRTLIKGKGERCETFRKVFSDVFKKVTYVDCFQEGIYFIVPKKHCIFIKFLKGYFIIIRISVKVIAFYLYVKLISALFDYNN